MRPSALGSSTMQKTMGISRPASRRALAALAPTARIADGLFATRLCYAWALGRSRKARMKPLLFYDDAFLRHHPGEGHPESPGRIAAITRRLAERPIAGTALERPSPATAEVLGRVHERAHL